MGSQGENRLAVVLEEEGKVMDGQTARAVLALLAKWALRRVETGAEPGEAVTGEANSLAVK
jgi:hypothetical protein